MKVALTRVEAHARAMAALTSETVEVGGFTAFLPRDEAAPAYAVPRVAPADGGDALADVAELRRLFQSRGLPVRVEMSLLAWQELTPSLVSAGLEPEEETPLFLCFPDRLIRPAAGAVDVRWVAPDEDLVFVGSVMRQGLELRGGPPTPEDVEVLRAALGGPLRLALATSGPAPVGTGCSAPQGGTTELSTISTLPSQRRGGVATALAAFMLREHFAAGGELAWACASDPAVAGLLYKVGFEDGGLRVSFAGL